MGRRVYDIECADEIVILAVTRAHAEEIQADIKESGRRLAAVNKINRSPPKTLHTGTLSSTTVNLLN